MAEIEELRAHLADRYGFRAKTVFSFDDDVTLLRDADGTGWVARTFPAERPRAAVEGDAAILRWLADHDYPAERPIAKDCVSLLGDRPVLVTEQVPAVPRARRRETIKDAGGIRRLGELLAWLHSLELDADAVRRPGGAWHHIADGSPATELAAAGDWLEQAEARAGVRELAHFALLADALADADGGDGLPTALIHPDFVLPNVVAVNPTGEDPGMVLVDWAGAGRGPRLWSLAFLLWAEGAKDLRRVDLAVAGYRRRIELTAEERGRLWGVISARPLVFEIWRLHHRDRAAADAAAAVVQSRRLAQAIAARADAAFGA